ncbi:hypothetical protein CPB86DRAFT_415969 [Serendipita vermifera]|nr:hypothetical protein CPB86DRAFT_415969 [Serendipita vermifera]
MKLRDSNAPNKATLYFDQLSLKPDAVVLVEHKTPLSAIIGGAVGGAALLVALGILLYLFIMKRKKAKKAEKEKNKGKEIGGDSEDPLTVPTTTDPRLSMAQSPSPYPAESALYSPRSQHGNNLGLPNYGAPSFVSQQQGLDLDGFARENPYLIDTVLLEKLRRARYSPAQHPTVISEGEWFSRYNIDKIEYERLCEAYAKYVPLLRSCTVFRSWTM